MATIKELFSQNPNVARLKLTMLTSGVVHTFTNLHEDIAYTKDGKSFDANVDKWEKSETVINYTKEASDDFFDFSSRTYSSWAKLTSNTTFTFTNLIEGGEKVMTVEGNYNLSFDNSVIVHGSYDGRKKNLIKFICLYDNDDLLKVFIRIFN